MKKPTDDSVYEKYLEWCQKIGVTPASQEQYTHTTRVVVGATSFMPAKRGYIALKGGE